jgi:hypothetical protein
MVNVVSWFLSGDLADARQVLFRQLATGDWQMTVDS